MRWRRRLGSRPMRIRGCRSGRFGLCSRWWMGVWGSRGWRAWPRISGGGGDDVDPARRARRFSAVRHLAELFDRYALHRPEMVRAWARGEDGGRCRPDGRVAGGAVAAAAGADRGSGSGGAGRGRLCAVAGGAGARRSAGAAVALRADAAARGASQRAARAGGRAGRACLHAPSVAGAVGAGGGAGCRGHPAAGGSDRGAAGEPAARLLGAGLAGDAAGPRGARLRRSSPRRSSTRTGTLLAHLQADVRADRWPAGAPLPGEADERPVLDAQRPQRAGPRLPRPRAAGRGARDAILHLLEEDPTLEPRDVIVMCPDIETFAPLIQATFGAGEVFEDDDELEALPADVRPPDLRVRLADRSLRQTNPVLGVVARLLDLVDERLTASQVLDFADQEPVRRRFGLDDDDLARIEDWVAASGIRWGLDAAHRAPFKLDALAAGTWRAGRGPAARRRDDDRGRAAAVRRRPPARRRRQRRDRRRRALRRAGRPAADDALDALSAPKTIDAWAAAIADAADALTATSERDAWQRAELDRLLGDVVDEAAAAASATEPRAGGDPGAAGRAPPGPPHARELPHRPPDHLHAHADAVGPASGRLPARAWTTASSRASRRATATTSCSPTPTSATATPAPRTASCCSTRCSPPPTS